MYNKLVVSPTASKLGRSITQGTTARGSCCLHQLTEQQPACNSQIKGKAETEGKKTTKAKGETKGEAKDKSRDGSKGWRRRAA